MSATAPPADPYDPECAVHVDALPEFNGDSKARFAFDDDGDRYKVVSGDNFPLTKLIPEQEWCENVLPERDGVGEPCEGCGNTIAWNAIIVNGSWHVGCYVAEHEE